MMGYEFRADTLERMLQTLKSLVGDENEWTASRVNAIMETNLLTVLRFTHVQLQDYMGAHPDDKAWSMSIVSGLRAGEMFVTDRRSWHHGPGYRSSKDVMIDYIDDMTAAYRGNMKELLGTLGEVPPNLPGGSIETLIQRLYKVQTVDEFDKRIGEILSLVISSVAYAQGDFWKEVNVLKSLIEKM